MTAPQPRRIQRSRAKGWQMPDGAVYVGRPTRWGNPFQVGAPITDDAMAGIILDGLAPAIRRGVVEDAEHAVLLYNIHIRLHVPFTRTDVVAELAGRDLVCWCKPDRPCHADLLLRMANGWEWMWLSFADPDLPKGQQFLGWAMVQAGDIVEAARTAHRLGINPGGQVAAYELPRGAEPADGYAERLFTGDEAKRIAATDPPIYLRTTAGGS